MHPNPEFRSDPKDRHLEFARNRAFGVLARNDAEGPRLAHVPFLLSGDGTSADLHLVRSNPVARMNDGPAVLAVSGPDGYISPDWYGIADQVPTWNYVAVHLRGRIERLPDDQLRDMLDRQSAAYETRLLPKPPWTTAKMTDATMTRFLRMLVPVRLHIDTIEGTWKLSQNKPDAARLGAAAAIGGTDIGHETAALAALMRDD